MGAVHHTTGIEARRARCFIVNARDISTRFFPCRRRAERPGPPVYFETNEKNKKAPDSTVFSFHCKKPYERLLTNARVRVHGKTWVADTSDYKINLQILHQRHAAPTGGGEDLGHLETHADR
ncbi:hypothetical protein LTR08_002031 [Meristemomyces frigidus]|nr:hypothetical protein LTR08_002031 [Meristemomyces frigidus]